MTASDELRLPLSPGQLARVMAGAVESCASALALVGLDGRLIHVNPAFLSLWGYETQAEVLGRPATSFWGSEEEAAAAQRAVARHGRWNGPMDARRRDGSRLRAEVVVTLVRDDLDAPLCFAGWVRQVDAPKEVEEAVRESEERYRGLVELSPDAVFVHVEGRFVYANQAGAALLGADSPQQLLGRPIQEFVHPQYRSGVRHRVRAIEGAGAAAPLIEEKFLRFDGSAVDVEAAGAPTVFLGEPAVQVVARDVSERKAAEERLRDSEERYRSLFELESDAIFVIDNATGRIIEANPAAEALYGYARAELLTLRNADLSAEPEETTRVTVTTPVEAERVVSIPLRRHRRKDGTVVPVEITGRFFVWGGREVHLAAIRDISDRLRAEEERRHLETHVRQAQKLEGLGVLAGGIAHDFNNLLTPIIGYTELALARLGDDHSVSRELRTVVEAAERAGTLTRQILAFSRKQALEMRAVDLNAEISAVDRLLRRTIGEDVEICLNLDPCLAAVNADPSQLQQVLLNLVVNARDAMPRGGIVTIQTDNVTLEEPTVWARADLPPGEYVSFTVSDTGCGIDAATLERVFEPFFTTKEPGRGTGLGLSTVYGIVKQHGGDVTVRSEPGKGATFRVFFPRLAAAAPPMSEPSGSAKAVGSGTILLVEDESMVRDLSLRILTDQGYGVLTAGSGEEALALAGRHPGRIDLLLTDVVMPGMSGPELFRELVGSRPDLRVLYMSGYPAGSGSLRDLLRGDEAFLAKPFSLSKIEAKVREVMATRPR